MIFKKQIVKPLYTKILLVALLTLTLFSVNAQFKIQPSFGYGSQSINYKSEYATVKGVSNYNFGINAFYYISQDIALGAGFHMADYGATAVFNNVSLQENRVDIDGEEFELTADFNGVNEEHTISVMEFPIFIRYQKWLSNNIMFFGSTGPVFIIPGTMSGKFTSGSVETSGYYPQWNLTIDDLPAYGFYARDLNEDIPEVEVKSSIGWNFEAGVELYVQKRINAFISACYMAGGNISNASGDSEILPDLNTFNGSMAGVDKISLSKLGIRIGLTIDLTPIEKAGIKSIR